uniref:CVNH domain-containing protein n=2 Tax=Steinernema glaseri TaxID=37863 RepID=A0A1I8AG26_9BILA
MDVLGRLNAHTWHYHEMEKMFTGRWKAAAGRYADNDRELDLKINFEEGEWGYSTRDYYDGDSLDEMLARDRRFLRFRSIDIGRPLGIGDISDDFKTTCSKEDIFDRLIPLIVRQLRPCNDISLWDGISRQHARMLFDAFLYCKGFRERCSSLDLPYFGPESEQFITTMLEDHCHLDCLSLYSNWPHSETVEHLVLKFLSLRVFGFGIGGLANDDGLKLNPTILKAVLDAWYRVETSFSAYAPWNGDLEPLLSIPLPQNVTRTQPEPKRRGGDESFIVWTKEDGSALACMVRAETVNFSTDSTSWLD